MFEVAEIGHKLSSRASKEKLPALKIGLLTAQQQLRDCGSPVIILVAGVEGAGKGAVINRLNEWMDSRGIETHAFWEETDEQKLRPFFWRFWRILPARGRISILFGSWYTQALIAKVYDELDEADFEHRLHTINEFEQLLAVDDALIIKLWFHMPKEAVQRQLETDAGNLDHLLRKSQFAKQFSEHYERFVAVSEHALRMTQSAEIPWHIIEATDENYRDITAGETVLRAMQQHLQRYRGKDSGRQNDSRNPGSPEQEQPTILDTLDMENAVAGKTYEAELNKWQMKLHQLCWQTHRARKSVVLVFEGWDAAGKGGTIRRLTRAMDARLYKVISTGAPSDEEAAHHYLWRFWRHIPLAGYITIYDRSWYGRVLVERVESFAAEEEWQRAYREITYFEEQLREQGIVLAKFWLHISREEQYRRFQARKAIPWKQYKITEDDWRNRKQWDAYKLAVHDMLAHTNDAHAPWYLVPANDKKFARLDVLKQVCKLIEQQL